MTATLSACSDEGGVAPVAPPEDIRDILPGKTTSLLSYFKFDSALLDAGTSGQTGTLSGTLDYLTGVQENALNFNYDNDHFTFAMANATQYTFMGWIKQHSARGTALYFFESGAFRLFDRAAQRVQLELKTTAGTGRWKTDPTDAYAVGEWTHIAVTIDLTTPVPADILGMVKIYINGVSKTVTLESAHTGTPLDNTLAPAVFGNALALNRPTDAAIDEFVIFNQVLTAAEILQIYNSQKP